jgi:hypothetical protein
MTAELIVRNVTFYIGDITKPEDVRNAINKVSSIYAELVGDRY